MDQEAQEEALTPDEPTELLRPRADAARAKVDRQHARGTKLLDGAVSLATQALTVATSPAHSFAIINHGLDSSLTGMTPLQREGALRECLAAATHRLAQQAKADRRFAAEVERKPPTPGSCTAKASASAASDSAWPCTP